ncbi:MAG TPA: hypothetical protein VNL96_01155 [Gemmatimonadaceae bacterium]|nr:hypothetical protein [Gemmatimonadaceae bacterium]
MLGFLNANAAAVTSIATCVLVVVTGIYAYLAYAGVKLARADSERRVHEREGTADAFRYLLLAEITRLMAPFQRLLEQREDTARRSSLKAERFEMSSSALREGLAHLHLLEPDERRHVARFALELAVVPIAEVSAEAESGAVQGVRRVVKAGEEARIELQRRLPKYPVAAAVAIGYESTKGGDVGNG